MPKSFEELPVWQKSRELATDDASRHVSLDKLLPVKYNVAKAS